MRYGDRWTAKPPPKQADLVLGIMESCLIPDYPQRPIRHVACGPYVPYYMRLGGYTPVWIRSVTIENFRGIKNSSIVLDKGLTILLGSNGSGKTSVIDAIAVFFNHKKVEEEDYHHKTEEPVRITMEFRDIPEELAEQFGGQSCITKEIPRDSDDELYINMSIYSKFKEILDMKAPDLKKAYVNIKKDFSNLPDVTGVSNMRSALKMHGASSDAEPTTIIKESVNQNILSKIKPFVIEAKKDPATDANESKQSTLGLLAENIIRNSEEESNALNALNQVVHALYDMHVINRSTGLQDTSEGISKMLDGIESDVGIKLSWEPWNDANMIVPKIRAMIREHGFTTNVDKAGHGAQRLFLYGILRYYHKYMSGDSTSSPNQVIVIDEPELHQHPIRQDAFYSVLRRLAESLQIIYATHSDKFISMKDLPRLRFFEKSGDEVIINSTDFERLAPLADKIIKNPTPEQMEKNLSVVDTLDFRSSLFSRKAVLVEGVSDRAVIKSVASKMKRDLTELGISVVPCSGKNNIREQLLVYRDLKIPYYVIWDLDLDQKKSKRNPKCTCHTNNENEEEANDKRNRRIFRYMGIEPPNTIESVVTKYYSCIRGNMNDLVNSFDEDIVEKYKKDIVDSLNVRPFNEKNDYMMEKLIDRIYENYRLDSIEEIVKKITDE